MRDHPTRRFSHDEYDRRGVLRCGAWTGAGILWTLSGGIAASGLLSTALARETHKHATATSVAPFSFLQISDTHIGFNKPANPAPIATLRQAIAQIKALAEPPAFLIHTGDISHLAKPKEFDDAQMILAEVNLPIHFVPGEHDVEDETLGRAYLERFGKGTLGTGWYSFDQNGVHFVALVNVVNRQSGLGYLGVDQLAWLKADLEKLGSSTPIVVFAHMPLWSIYEQWGWGTQDAALAMILLARFGSVTVLNGHIHQIIQKEEGHMTFHTARSTSYPQPAPGSAPSPGPKLVPADMLRSYLGLTSVKVRLGQEQLALTDTTLAF